MDNGKDIEKINTEASKLIELMKNAGHTGDWEAVSQELNMMNSGGFANHRDWLNTSASKAALECQKAGLPIMVITDEKGQLTGIKDSNHKTLTGNSGVDYNSNITSYVQPF